MQRSPVAVRPGFFVARRQGTVSAGNTKGGVMKILKLFFKIKYLAGFKWKQRIETGTVTAYGDVKHPAEFLIRW